MIPWNQIILQKYHMMHQSENAADCNCQIDAGESNIDGS